jgi:hypothetical protein
VKPSLTRTVMKTGARALNGKHRVNLNFSNRPVRTRMPGGVGGESGYRFPSRDMGRRGPFDGCDRRA